MSVIVTKKQGNTSFPPRPLEVTLIPREASNFLLNVFSQRLGRCFVSDSVGRFGEVGWEEVGFKN